MLRRVQAVRYVTPLREGGSLPAIIEGDDGQLYVVKFRGAGQGEKALVAEVLAGELARALGLPIPEQVVVGLDPVFGKTEPDPEIRELLAASAGENLGLAYLAGATMFDPAAPGEIDEALAARIVVFDAYVTNVDRTARNPNMLWWHDRLWIIDHGAALYWHHDWDGGLAGAERRFPAIRDHVLLPRARGIAEAGAALVATATDALLAAVVALVPDAWLSDPARRVAYAGYLAARRDQAAGFLEEAEGARARRV